MMPALIGALGSVVGAGLTASAINDQNEKATGQFNRNLSFQRWQYNDMKRWQSPENYVGLLRRAGLNPALVMGQGSTSAPVQGVGGVAPTASHTTADFQGMPTAAGNLMSSLQGLSLSDAQKANLDEDTRNKAIKNQTQLRSDLASIEKQLSDKRVNDQQRLTLQVQRNYLQKQLDYADEYFEWTNENLRLSAAKQSFENKIADVTSVYTEPQMQAAIKQLGALAFMNFQQGKLAGKTIDKIEAETLSEFFQIMDMSPKSYQNWKLYKMMSSSENGGSSLAKQILGYFLFNLDDKSKSLLSTLGKALPKK